jgi:hypothetical protein
MVANLAPHRGGDFESTTKSDATAALSQAAVLGAKDQIQIASWQNGILNLNSYIAGGSGALQNEFGNIAHAQADVFAATDSDEVLSLLSPVGFAVSGSNTTAALRGTKTHAVLVEIEFTFLDYMGGIVQGPATEGTSVRNRLKAIEQRLLLLDPGQSSPVLVDPSSMKVEQKLVIRGR